MQKNYLITRRTLTTSITLFEVLLLCTSADLITDKAEVEQAPQMPTANCLTIDDIRNFICLTIHIFMRINMRAIRCLLLKTHQKGLQTFHCHSMSILMRSRSGLIFLRHANAFYARPFAQRRRGYGPRNIVILLNRITQVLTQKAYL